MYEPFEVFIVTFLAKSPRRQGSSAHELFTTRSSVGPANRKLCFAGPIKQVKDAQ